MTVFTKAEVSEEKKAAEVESPAEVVVVPSAPAEEGDSQRNQRKSKKRTSSFGALSIVRLTPSPLCRTPSPPRGQSPNDTAHSRSRRRSILLRQLGIVCFLLLLCAAFLSGYYYRHLVHRRNFRGWCGVMVNDASGRPQSLAQKVEIDTDALYEKIDVPKFGSNRPAIFVHDFKQNMTAIVDVAGRRCFLKPLDRAVIAPPRNFIDILNSVQGPYMEPPSRVIRETFKVGSAVTADSLSRLNSLIISRHCQFRPVFYLRKISETEELPALRLKRRRRRDAAQPAAEAVEPLEFMSLSGDSLQVEKILI